VKKIYLGLAAAVAAMAVVPASAITAFAAFTPLNNGSNINFTPGAGGTGTVSSTPGSAVTFRFLDATGANSVFDVAATFNFLTSTLSGIVAGGLGIAPASTGSFSFLANAPVSFNGKTGVNLLTGSFAGGAFSGLIGGSVASYVNSQPPSAVTFTSDFLDFSQTTARDISIAINAINPSISGGASGLGEFSGTATGVFGSDLAAGSPNGVPEPASWAMFVGGFGLIGVMARRRSGLRVVEA
jgi:hypothetical protein